MPATQPTPSSPAPDNGFVLSLATMEWLVEQGRLTPTAASPFGVLGVAKRQTTAEEQAAAARRELGDKPNPALTQALDIASEPESRIRMTAQVPGQPARQLTLFARSSAAVQAGFSSEGFLFRVPMTLGALEALLIDQLRSSPPASSLSHRLVTPGALGLLSALWPQSGHACTDGVPLKDALASCQRLGVDEPAAQRWVDALAASALVEQNDASLSISEDWQPWLQPLWSQERFEIEVTPFPEGDLQAPSLAQNRQRLLFVGPKGQRIAVRMVDEASLDEVPLGVPISPGQGGALVALSYLDGTFLAQNVGALLRVTLEGLPHVASGLPAPQSTDAGVRRS